MATSSIVFEFERRLFARDSQKRKTHIDSQIRQILCQAVDVSDTIETLPQPFAKLFHIVRRSVVLFLASFSL